MNFFIQKIQKSTKENTKIDSLIRELLIKLKNRKDIKRAQNTEETNNRKRRLVCGAHETLKYAQSGKVNIVFYAKNVDENNIRAASNFYSLQKICPTLKIPLIEALTRKELSRIMNKFPYVAVVGIMDFDGFEKDVEEILKEWRCCDSYKNFHIDQSSLLP